MAATAPTGVKGLLRLNLGGEGEESDCINQQPPWVDLCDSISRNGQPLRSLTYARVPVLFCDNTCLCFPDSVVDSIITNGVPVDQGATWLGPSVSSIEIKRVLKSGGTWYNDGVLVYRKP
jgi:hypothetical protein